MKSLNQIAWDFYHFFTFYSKAKALLAFEFAIVLSDVAHELKLEVTPEIVKKAEDLLVEELGRGSSEKFAASMNVYVLAVLEPKDNDK